MFKRLDPKSGVAAETVNIIIEGKQVSVPKGESVAAAMLVHCEGHTRTTAITGSPRAPFCLMGVCYECLMVIDGKPNQQACMIEVREGMHIERQQGPGASP